MIRFGICFSREFSRESPLGHIGQKLPVYLRLLELCEKEGWEIYVLTRRTYEGGKIFNGGWLYKKQKFTKEDRRINIDLVYDRSGGIKFPPKDDSLKVINRRDFKILCWNKWKAYKKIGKDMPTTFWVGKAQKNLPAILAKIKTKFVVLKPYNGLKGIGVFIGDKKDALDFKFSDRKYIAQEFVDTSGGIDGIVRGLHDLRIVVVNGKVVWCHVRTPHAGSFKANVAEGGTLTEIDYEKVPGSIKKIVAEISRRFYKEYDNPAYSIDFGIEKGIPHIFEINDQVGFPQWEMKNRENFLRGLIKTFKRVLNP